MKKIISILVFVMVLFCLSGCMQKNFQEIAVDYMTEKYDEDLNGFVQLEGNLEVISIADMLGAVFSLKSRSL